MNASRTNTLRLLLVGPRLLLPHTTTAMRLVALATSLPLVLASATMPTGARVGLWSLETDELLEHFTSPPLRTRFGMHPQNVSGVLMKPPLAGLCDFRPEMTAWRDRVILAGDWTSPGCSIEERSRVLTAVGAAAAIFLGTEGLPLDWDGSSYDTIQIPVVVIGKTQYSLIAAAIDEATSPSSPFSALRSDDMETFLSAGAPPADLMIWLVPGDTPLLHDAHFRTFDRVLQGFFFFVAACNVLLALHQLRSFIVAAKRLAATSNKLQAGSAIKVIILELISALAMMLYVVDGPGMEHTRPVVLPWFVHRMALAAQYESHMLALLVSSSHLLKIRKRVQDTSIVKPRRRSNPTSAAIDDNEDPESNEPNDEKICCAKVASYSHGIFVGSLMALIIVDLFISVISALYIAADDITIIAGIYIALVTLVIGTWFIWQAHVIVSLLKRADQSKDASNRRVSRLSQSAMRIGIIMIISVVRCYLHCYLNSHCCYCCFVVITLTSVLIVPCTQLVSVPTEIVLRPMLVDSGGWVYWWTLYPLWALMTGMFALASTLQILAFQPPSTATTPSNANATDAENSARRMQGRRVSMSNAILNDVVRRVAVRMSIANPKYVTRASQPDDETPRVLGNSDIPTSGEGQGRNRRDDPLRGSDMSAMSSMSDHDKASREA